MTNWDKGLTKMKVFHVRVIGIDSGIVAKLTKACFGFASFDNKHFGLIGELWSFTCTTFNKEGRKWGCGGNCTVSLPIRVHALVLALE